MRLQFIVRRNNWALTTAHTSLYFNTAVIENVSKDPIASVSFYLGWDLISNYRLRPEQLLPSGQFVKWHASNIVSSLSAPSGRLPTINSGH
jgi:hypothetical protein